MPLSPGDIPKHLNWRAAVKKFDPAKKLNDDTAHALMESLRLSPSSYGLQPWKFIVITNQELKEELKPHAWNQDQITDCSHLVVLCARTTMPTEYIEQYADDIAATRKVERSRVEGFEDMIKNGVSNKSAAQIEQWNKHQLYIAAGFLMSAAAYLEIDSCPMEGFVSEEFNQVLGLTDTEYTSTVLVALGYRAGGDYVEKAKVRFDAKDVFDWRE